jgi:hypothetical protein
LFLHGLQFLRADLCPFFFVGVPAWRNAQHHHREQGKESEKQHHAEPGREGRLRLSAVEWFWRGHG